MELNLSIIRFHLAKKHTALACYNLDLSLEIKGIRHYVDGYSFNNHLVIIEAQKLPFIDSSLKNNLFISIGKPETISDSFSFSLMSVENNVIKEELFNDLHQIFELIAEWDLQLQKISKSSQNFQALFDCCENIAIDPFALINHQYRYVAYIKELSKERGYIESLHNNNYLTINTVNHQLITPGYEEMKQQKNVFEFIDEHHIIAKNIFFENQYVGRLITMHSEDSIRNSYNVAIMDHLSGYIEQMYAQYGSFSLEISDINKIHEMVYSSLTNNPISDDNWIELLDKLDWKISDDYILIQFQPKYQYEKKMYAEYLCPQIENIWRNSCAVSIDETAIMLLNYSKCNSDFHNELMNFLRDSLLIAGMSRIFHGFSQLKIHFRQTTIAIELGGQINTTYWYFKFDDYALEYLIQYGIADFNAEQICCNSLLLLKMHDLQMHTQYYLTLYTYFKHQYNAVAAARELFIHRSTFMNRMDRIKELTKLDLNDWNTLLYLMLSFHIL